MSMLHTAGVEEVIAGFSSREDPILERMERRADREGFPTVGPEVGAFLAWFVRAADVRRVFECGSGFGYSAYWMATELPDGGEIVLTEIDADELADAERYFREADLADRARFLEGDALEALAAEDGPFDLVILDHENERYREGLSVATARLAPGGTVLADNVLHSWEFDPEDVVAGRDTAGGAPSTDDADPSLSGILEFYRAVETDPALRACVLPLGEGMLAATRIRPDR